MMLQVRVHIFHRCCRSDIRFSLW